MSKKKSQTRKIPLPRPGKRVTKKQLESIPNSPMFVKKRAESIALFSSPGYKAFRKKYPNRNSPKSLATKTKSTKKTASKSNPEKLKRFTKAQLDAIHNSPMVVRKNKAADEFFSSPGYKAIARDSTAKKKIKDVKKKHR